MKRTKKANVKILYSFLAILIICSMLFSGAPFALAKGVYPDTNEDGTLSAESEYYNTHNKPVFYGTTGITVPVGTAIDYKWDARFRVFAKDNEDGDITKNIKASDDINVNEAGTYHITYSVTDSHGNTSTLDVPVTVEKDGATIQLEKTMYSLPSVDHLNSVGQTRGNNMDRQMIGIFVEAGASFEMKKQSAGNMTVKLSRNDANQESEKTVSTNGSWTTIINEITSGTDKLYYDTVPTVKTLYKQTGTVTYTVRYDANDKRIKPLHYYHEGDGAELQQKFLDEWNADTNSYAMVDGLSVMVLIPYQDRDHMFYMPYPGGKPYKSFEHFFSWWNDIMDEYDELIGLSYTPEYSWNQNVKTKYFVKANAHGAGAAYYNSGDHVGINSSSVWPFFQVGWGDLHEVGHGYQGNLNGNGYGMGLGEVGVNIGGYYIQDVAHKFIYNESWLGLAKNEASYNKARLAGLGYLDNGAGNIGAAAMLYSLVNALDYFEDFSQSEVHGYKEADATINQYYRKHYNETGEKLQTADAWCLALAEKYHVNFVLYFESWGVKVSDYVKEALMQSDAKLVYYLRDLVGDDTTAKNLKPASNVGIYDLVTTDELQALSGDSLFANVEFEFKIDDISEIMGKSLYIADGDTIVKTIRLTDENVTDNTITVELPVGAYKVAVPKPNGVYDFDNQYVLAQKGTENHYEIVYNTINDISFGNDIIIKSRGYWGVEKVPFMVEIISNQMKFTFQGTYPNSNGTKNTELFSSLTVYDTEGNTVFDNRVNGGMSQLFTNQISEEKYVDVALGYKLKIYYLGNVNDVRFYSSLTGEQLTDYNINSSTHERTYVVTQYGLIPEDILGDDYPNSISNEAYQSYKDRLDAFIESYKEGKTEDELYDPFSPNKGSNIVKNALKNLREEDVEEYTKKLESITTGEAPVITSSEGNHFEFDIAQEPHKTIEDVYEMITVTDKEDGTIYENGALTATAKEKGDTVTFDSDVDWTTPGTYHVTVTAMDSHENISTLVLEAVLTDSSTPDLTDISDFEIAVDGAEAGFTYTGEAVTPTVTVTDQNGHILTEGIDYKVTYENNINAGQATIKVEALSENGIYEGELSVSFTIDKADPEVLPSSAFVVENDVDTVEGITLPEGWHWENADVTLEVGENTLIAVYDGDLNHNSMTIEITVTRKEKEEIPDPLPEIPETDPDDDDVSSSGTPWGDDNPNFGGDFTEDPATDVEPNDDGNGEAKDPNGQDGDTSGGEDDNNSGNTGNDNDDETGNTDSGNNNNDNTNGDAQTNPDVTEPTNSDNDKPNDSKSPATGAPFIGYINGFLWLAIAGILFIIKKEKKTSEKPLKQ